MQGRHLTAFWRNLRPTQSRTTIKRSFADFKDGSSGSSSSQQSWFAWYSRRLDTHPVSTKCISAGLISSLGNVLAQMITYQQEMEKEEVGDVQNQKKAWKDFRVDTGQVGRFAFLNVIFVAPVLHHWYNFINRALPGKSISRVLQRTFWDEFVFSPIYIPVFLAGLWKLEGTSWPKIQTMMVKEVPGIIVAEWALWVPTMIVTFRYAPVKFQVLVINVVGVVWQTFLSFMAAHAHGADTHEAKEEDQGCETTKHGDQHHIRLPTSEVGASPRKATSLSQR